MSECQIEVRQIRFSSCFLYFALALHLGQYILEELMRLYVGIRSHSENLALNDSKLSRNLGSR